VARIRQLVACGIQLTGVPQTGVPATQPQFTFSFSIFVLAMVVLGGLGSIWGVVLGAIVVTELNIYLLPRVLHDLPSKVGLDFDLSAVASGISGFVLLTVMLLRPDGLLPDRRRRLASRAGR
jgi:branched-chain amino acid transport system permease protein